MTTRRRLAERTSAPNLAFADGAPRPPARAHPQGADDRVGRPGLFAGQHGTAAGVRGVAERLGEPARAAEPGAGLRPGTEHLPPELLGQPEIGRASCRER